jgi:hypothetical protein
VAVRNALADLPTVGSSCLFAMTPPRAGLTRPRDFDDPVITITCPTRIAWHTCTRNTGVVMRKLFIFSALVFALVTGATATVVATTLQSQSAVALGAVSVDLAFTSVITALRCLGGEISHLSWF